MFKGPHVEAERFGAQAPEVDGLGDGLAKGQWATLTSHPTLCQAGQGPQPCSSLRLWAGGQLGRVPRGSKKQERLAFSLCFQEEVT